MKQKSANIISIQISKEIFVDLTCFVSNKVILKHWIHLSEFEVEFEVNFLRSEFKVGFQVFNLVQDFVFSSIENNPIMLLILKRTVTKKIFYSSVTNFDKDERGSMKEIGKSLSFSEVS